MKELLSSVDREFIAGDPYKLWKNGTIKLREIIIGITKDEIFFALWTLIISHRDILFYLEHFEDVRNHYIEMHKLP